MHGVPSEDENLEEHLAARAIHTLHGNGVGHNTANRWFNKTMQVSVNSILAQIRLLASYNDATFSVYLRSRWGMRSELRAFRGRSHRGDQSDRRDDTIRVSLPRKK